jgi:hypothetical protein
MQDMMYIMKNFSRPKPPKDAGRLGKTVEADVEPH